jgi:hypothetical protein
MNIQEIEAESPNIRKPREPIHLAGKIKKHEGKTQEISSHKPG